MYIKLFLYSGGYSIPKGTQVTINHWALHHDPEAWDQVDKFIPERYLGEDGKMGPKPKNWLPFSAGKRVCLGEFVAKPEIRLIFATLMQKFKWKPEPGVILAMKPGGTEFICVPKPYNVVLEKRF